MASPLASGDNVYVLDHKGHTILLAAGPEMKVVATNSLDDLFWSSPAAAKGRLYLRGATFLHCIKECAETKGSHAVLQGRITFVPRQPCGRLVGIRYFHWERGIGWSVSASLPANQRWQ
jgi:hypothetical protein